MSHHPDAEKLMRKLNERAERSGYHLNPDTEFVLDLMDGLLTNLERYGYQACPCMEADGERELDLDIICPCDYRDADLVEHGACYCALYVSKAVVEGKQEAEPIPLRRPEDPGERPQAKRQEHAEQTRARRDPLQCAETPVWRCTVCGYLAARQKPPLTCPICQADQDRFFEHAPRSTPLWRCTVCGYLAAREEPPLECPVCWATQDRFELLA
jgi:ferredoxin-thioredoxin reductase catalytic subunit/rubredoxin